MADYLSRHPTEKQGASIKAETLWNEWFTVNSINSLNDVLENKQATSERSNPDKSESENNCVNSINQARKNQPIRAQDTRNSRETSKPHCSANTRKSKMDRSPSNKLFNERILPANYVADKLIQKAITLVKTTIRRELPECRCPSAKNFSRSQ